MYSRILKLSLLAGMILTVSCGKSASDPLYGVCANPDKYPEIEAAGYDFIECGVSAFLVPDKSDEEFRAKLDEQERLGSRILACNGFLPGDYTVVGQEAKHEKILIWAENAFRRAQTAGISYIVFGSGGARRIPEGFSKDSATQQFVDLCKKLGPIAGKYKVTVVIEPLNSAETNLINSVAEGAAIVEAVDHPNIRLLCDFYHMLKEGEPASDIVRYSKYIKHCHIAEPARTAPGTDNFDFTPFFDALKEIKYSGGISVECFWSDFGAQLAPALAYMKGLYEKDR